MPKAFQSIEDLIDSGNGNGQGDDGSVQAKFQHNQEELKKKEFERLVKKQADGFGLPYIYLVGFPISPEALVLVQEKTAKELDVACFYYDGESIRIAVIEPTEAIARLAGQLEETYHCRMSVYVVSRYSMDYAHSLYRVLPKIKEAVRGLTIDEEELNRFSDQLSRLNELQDYINKASISDIVTVIIAAAIKADSSDIHVEGEEKAIKVRFRIDGVLHDVAALEKKLWPKIISRLKLLAGVKINITNKPQDGRISIYLKAEKVDIRCSFLPTAFGESVVMRILRSSAVGLAFEDLGMRGEAYERLKREVERPNGMIVTTGPTGSGKTTTLYAILKKLNNPETKIITIEDPIEYQLAGINQSQTTEKYTFAQALKSIVRQDPDIIMVGEIRDLETAEISIQAALTGHLVLSTIHTNDASGTIPRFLSMGAKPYLLAPAINAMIGQRLVRRLCEKCKGEAPLSQEEMRRVEEVLDRLPEKEKEAVKSRELKFFNARGCEACQGIGYRGRIGIYEIMTMNPEVEKLILTGKVSEYDMLENGRKNGMLTMVQDGILKALDGITTVEEVFRVAE